MTRNEEDIDEKKNIERLQNGHPDIKNTKKVGYEKKKSKRCSSWETNSDFHATIFFLLPEVPPDCPLA